MNVLAQTQSSGGFSGVLESAPTGEIMIMSLVFMICSTLLLMTITVCVTGTIRAIRIAAINSRLTEKLVKEGVPHNQIERLVRANSRRCSFPVIAWPSRWQKAEPRVAQTPGKPASVSS